MDDVAIQDFQKQSKEYARYLERVLKQAQQQQSNGKLSPKLKSQLGGFSSFCAEFTPLLKTFHAKPVSKTIDKRIYKENQKKIQVYIKTVASLDVFSEVVDKKDKLAKQIKDIKIGLNALIAKDNDIALLTFCRILSPADQKKYASVEENDSDQNEIGAATGHGGVGTNESAGKNIKEVNSTTAYAQAAENKSKKPSDKARPLPCGECKVKEQELLHIRGEIDKTRKEYSNQLEEANNALKTKEEEKLEADVQLKDSKKENRKLTSQIREMEDKISLQNMKIDQLSHSLAEEMGNKVGADESSIENVSIKNRPMNVADDYSNFCTNAWLDAKDVLDEKFKTKYNEKDMIRFLLDVLQISYREVRKNVNLAVDHARKVGVITIHQILNSPLPVPPDIGKLKLDAVKADTKIPADGKDFVNYNAMGDFLRIQAEKRDRKELYEHIKKEIKKECDKMPGKQKQMYGDFYKLLNSGMVYLKESIDLSYKMAIQRPPMEFSLEGIGRPWNEKTQDLNWGTKKEPNSVVELYVHPVLLHGGKLMTKGKVVLCVNMGK